MTPSDSRAPAVAAIDRDAAGTVEHDAAGAVERGAAGPAGDMEDTDPGLARERTGLAWTRTAISFAALGGAVLKTTAPVGALVLAMSAVVWGLGRMSRHPQGPEFPR